MIPGREGNVRRHTIRYRRTGVRPRANPTNASGNPADTSIMNDLHYLHPSAELLDRYAMNRLSDGTLDYVEEHLLLCPSCSKALNVLDRDIKLMRAVLGPQEVNGPVWARA